MSNQEPLTRRPAPTPISPNILQRWVMNRGRYGRMAFVFVGALMLAMLLSPVVELIYFRLTGTYIGESSIPNIIVMVFCFGLYLSGYVFVIGTPGSTPEDSRQQRIYIPAVFAIILFTIIWYTVQILSATSGA